MFGLYIIGSIVAYAVMGGFTVGLINSIEGIDPKDADSTTGMVVGGLLWPLWLFGALPAFLTYKGMIKLGKSIRKKAKEKEALKEKKRIAEEKMRIELEEKELKTLIELEEIENSLEEELKAKKVR